MKANKSIFIWILLVASWIFFISYSSIRKKDSELEPKTDTLYLTKSFKPETQYKTITVPKLVVFYAQDTVPVKKIEADLERINLTLGSGKLESFSTQFLAKHPQSSKLIQLLLEDSDLSITQMDTQGKIFTERYSVYPKANQYNYFQGKMTHRPRKFIKKLEFSSELMVRPLSNLWDLNLGICHKTSFISYEIGLNSHWYPHSVRQFGIDPYLRVKYNF